jgi:predicted Zn-dependent peptidase
MILLAVPGLAEDRLQLPDFEEFELDNGLRVRLLRYPTVPLMSAELWIAAGSRLDPPGREGLAALSAEALRKGAGERDAQQFALALDQLGARLTTSVDADRLRVRLNLLARDMELGLKLMGDAVLRPRFEPAEIDKLSAQLSEGIATAKDNPRNVLSDYHRSHLYTDHPYANPQAGTETGLRSISAEDVGRFHRDWMGSDRSVLVVAGDIEPAEAAKIVRASFGDMQRAAQELPLLATPTSTRNNRVMLVNKPDTPQTWFMIGTLGPSWRETNLYAATELVRTVFGGRFTSWLNQKLRIESGLTYGARYNLGWSEASGVAAISTFTATETTERAIDLALAQLDRLHEQGLSEEDLASAKAYFKGQRPYDYETAGDLAAVLAELGFYGVDRSFVDDLFARVDAVTLEDCRQVIERFFGREDLVFTAIGVADEVKKILEKYGPVTIRENSAPGFGMVASGSR